MTARSPTRAAFAATTLCSILSSFGLFAHAAGSHEGDHSETETQVISRYLQSSSLESALQAAALEKKAEHGPAPVGNPDFQYRHEADPGSNIESIDSVGGSVRLDLGFAAAAGGQAARLRKQALTPRHYLHLFEDICALRGELRSLWEAQQRVAIVEVGHARIHQMQSAITAMAKAGLTSTYDRERADLADASHRIELGKAKGDAASLRASIESRAGATAEKVNLLRPQSGFPLAKLLEQVDQSHPAILALELEQDAARKDAVAAQLEVAPELRLSGAARLHRYDSPAPPDVGFELGVSLELPLFDHKRREQGAAAALVQRKAADALAFRQEIQARVKGAWVRREAAKESREKPLDTHSLWAAARQRYQAGEASAYELLQLARELERAEIAQIEAERYLQQAELDLQCAMGRFDDREIQQMLDEVLR